MKKIKFKKSLFFLLMPIFIWLGTNFVLTNSFVYSVSAATSGENVTISASLFNSLLQKIDSLVAEVSTLKKTVSDFISGKSSTTSNSTGTTNSGNNATPENSTGTNTPASSNPTGSTGSTEALDNLVNSFTGSNTTNNSSSSNANANLNSNQNSNKSLTSEITSWFKKILGLNENKNAQSSAQQQQTPQPTPSEQPAQQQQQGGGQQGGEENGTGKKPFKLEPNQFKKLCGQNTYVLYYRIGGIGKRDMLKPTEKEGTGAGGESDTGEYTFELPSCAELAKCHCCCNTCQIPETECKKEGWVFAKKGCVLGCSDKCEANCKKGCKDWKKPTPAPGAPFNRDCDCQMEGCPDGKDCMIIIKDEGNTKLQYTTKKGKPEQYFPAAGFAYFMNGNGPSDEKSKIKSDGGNDTKDQGWIKKLKEEPGICCSCIQDAQ